MPGVLFDVGYALMDERLRLRASLEWMEAKLEGVPLERLLPAYEAACVAPDKEQPSLIVQMLVELGVPLDRAEALRREMPWDAVPLSPYDDAAAALRRLGEAGLRVGVLANQPVTAQEDLERAGLTSLCDGIWLSDAVGLAKPDPAFFRVALEAWGLPVGEVAYVGDRPDNDIAPAKRLGLRTIRVLTGPHAGQAARNPDEEADETVENLVAAAEAAIRAL